MTVLEKDQSVPERLVQPLQIVAGRARMLAYLRAIFQLVALCSGIWLAGSLLMGSLLRVPLWLGIPLVIAGWALLLYGGYRILRPLFGRRNDLASAARMADDAMPDSQERISSAVEISQEQDTRFRGSPELIAVLLRQAEHHADTMDPGTVISGRDVVRWLSGAITLAVVWLLLLIILTPNMLLGMQRMIQPWTAADALPGPVLDVTPGDVVLAQDATLAISVNVRPPQGLSFDNGHGEVGHATIIQQFSASGTDSPEISKPMESTLDVTDKRSFHLNFDKLQQSFSYRIVVEGSKNVGRAESPTYSVTVQSRPAVTDMELNYSYPAYTGLNPRTDHSREGMIEAVVGTKVRVTAHTTEPVKTASIAISDDGSGPRNIPLIPVPSTATSTKDPQAAYSAEFTILKSSDYKVRLVKDDGRDNTDSQPRPIHARPDNPPVIAIAQPDARIATLKVRPDDTVPLKFTASDDYGLSRIEALVQVDDHNEMHIDLPLDDRLNITGDWDLKLADILKNLPTNETPKRVSYQFRATDNRDPDPQYGLSSRQYLDLDKTIQPLAQRMDTQAAQQLSSAIKTAQNKLMEAEAKLAEVDKSDTNAKISDADRKKLDDAQQALSTAGEQLRRTANEADDTRLKTLSDQVRQIADHPVKAADEETTKARLASDQFATRRDSVAAARRSTQQAIDQINALADNIRRTASDQPLAQALERMAQEQKKIADDLAKNPQDPAALAAQEKLQKDLDKLIKDNPDLQKPAAEANQAKVDDLVKKLRDLQNAQQPIADQLNNAEAAKNLPEKTSELAKKQDDLNREISQFNQRQAEAMKNAGAQPPEQSKLDPIVKELKDNKLATAEQDQKAMANSLDQAASRLDAAQKRADNAAGGRQAAEQQAQKDAQTVSNLQTQTQQLAQDIQRAKGAGNPPTRITDPANQQASRLADQIKQAAQQVAQHTAPGSPERAAAQNAMNQADAAKTSATRLANADRAQQQLSDAANQLSQAAKSPSATSGAQSSNAIAQAADQAKSLASQQRELATQSNQIAKSQEQAAAAKSNAPATSDRQRELADKMSEAARDAQSIQQQAQGPAPALAEKATQAAKAVQQAADAQRMAAQSTRSLDATGAAARQSQAAEKLADAEEALTGQRPQRSTSQTSPGKDAQFPPNQNSAQNTSQNSSQQTAAQPSEKPATPSANSVQNARDAITQAAKGNPQAAQQAADQLAQASRQMMGDTPPGSNAPAGNPQAGGESPPMNASGPPTQAPGKGQGQGEQQSQIVGGKTSGDGIKLAMNGRPIDLPKEVQEVGVSPSDWVKLSPELQNELIHSAQQPGPPSYRDMIKNYYSRIARIQPSGAPQ